MSVIKYAGFSVDTAALPAASIEALLRRGITHFLGNEQASKVTSWAKRQAAATPPVVVTDEEKTAQHKVYIEQAIAVLNAGTIGQRTAKEGGSTAKLDPVGSMVRKLAKATVVTLLGKAKLKVPKGEAKVATGSGEFTMAELIDRQIAKGGEALVAEAKKAVEAEARRNAKVAETAGDEL